MQAQKKSDPIQDLVTQARRDQILSAAAQIFAERGYHRATIRQIAQRAGVADGTIYNYFENKSDLLFGLLDQLSQAETDESQFSGLTHTDFRKTFAILIEQRLRLYRSNIELFKAVLPEMLVDPELSQRYFQQNIAPTLIALEEHLAARANAGHIRPVDFRLTAQGMVALHTGLLILHLLGNQSLTVETADLADAIVSILYDGLKPTGV